jgi:outer membrane immunogenic protein
MKKATLALAIFAVFCAAVYAGPEQYSGKEMKQVAPAPPACPTWTGFYVGGFAGYKFSSVDTNLALGDLWNTQFPEGRDALEAAAPHNLDNSGFEAGGLIGYNYQWHNWVFGVEAEGGYLWAHKANNQPLVTVPNDPIDGFALSTSFDTHYLATFAPRIGYTFCRWMPYVTAGLAVGELDYSQNIVNVLSPALGPYTFSEGASKSETNVGWMVGGGLEYSVTDHWRVRGQYQFIDLGSVDFDTAGVGSVLGATGFTGHHEASLREHNASFAIIYGF